MFRVRNVRQTKYHGRTGQFFRGLSRLCPKNISTAPEKTPNLTWPKNMLSTTTSRHCLHFRQAFHAKLLRPTHPTQIVISKNPEFRALLLAGRNEFRFFHVINRYNIFHFDCWLLPEKFSVCPQNNSLCRLPESQGMRPPAPGSYTYAKCIKIRTYRPIRFKNRILSVRIRISDYGWVNT